MKQNPSTATAAGSTSEEDCGAEPTVREAAKTSHSDSHETLDAAMVTVSSSNDPFKGHKNYMVYDWCHLSCDELYTKIMF